MGAYYFRLGVKPTSGNLIIILISLELILFSIGLILVNLSIGLDDLIGGNITLYLLPLAGAESAVALALLVAYYPHRGSISIWEESVIRTGTM